MHKLVNLKKKLRSARELEWGSGFSPQYRKQKVEISCAHQSLILTYTKLGLLIENIASFIKYASFL
jgi:hypothetical protein